MTLLLAASLLAQAASPEAPSVHQRNPDALLQTYSYICDSVERRITLRYDVKGFQELLSASRHGDSVPSADLATMSNAIKGMDVFYTMIAQCSYDFDLLMFIGRHRGQEAIMTIRWYRRQMTALPLEFINYSGTARQGSDLPRRQRN